MSQLFRFCCLHPALLPLYCALCLFAMAGVGVGQAEFSTTAIEAGALPHTFTGLAAPGDQGNPGLASNTYGPKMRRWRATVEAALTAPVTVIASACPAWAMLHDVFALVQPLLAQPCNRPERAWAPVAVLGHEQKKLRRRAGSSRAPPKQVGV